MIVARLVLFLATPVLALVPAHAGETLRIGVLDYSLSERAREYWRTTEDALNRSLPEYEFRIEPLDIVELDAALAADELDFVITNPGNYVVLEYRHHISRIATADADLPVASTLVTKGDLETLVDLAGRRLAIVATEAFGGFQVIWSEMADADSALPRKVELVVTGYPMRAAAEAVLSGTADAAVLRACMLEELLEESPRFGELRPFAVRADVSDAIGCASSSPVYPGWPFAKARRTSPALAKQVAVALMQMETGNLWTVPLDYQPVHELMRRLQIGPYARSSPVSLGEIVAAYRNWLIIFVVALVFWALYSIRIESLVRRRTQALDEANAALKTEMAERKRAEEADRQHRHELEHVARLSILGEMATSIAHELNQPLGAISSYAQGCLLRIGAGDFSREDMRRVSQEIADQAERASAMIKRIRAFVARRERQPATVAPSALVRDCASIFSASARRAGVQVATEIDEDLPEIEVDVVQIQQVILNLVQNGIDAMEQTPDGDRQLTICAERRKDATRGEGVAISVRDRGHGMTAEALDHFAEPFYTTKSEGIGLGLALSQSIVEAHAGWMRAEQPEDGAGLRVVIWLPARGGDE